MAPSDLLAPSHAQARGQCLTVLIAAERTPLVQRLVGSIERRGHEVVMAPALEAGRALQDRSHHARVLTFSPRNRDLLGGDDRPTLVLVEASGTSAMEALRAGAAAILHPDAPEVALERALAALLAPLEHAAAACACAAAMDGLLRAMPVGVAVAQDGQLLSCNQALIDLVGGEAASYEGKSVATLFHVDDASDFQRRAEAAAAWSGVARLLQRGGAVLDARVTLLPWTREGRPAIHLLVQGLSPEACASRELAEFRGLVQERRDLVFLGSLVQSVVHDLRNPLQAALFGISTLKGGGRPGTDSLGMIERKVREIDAILAELHDCAQPWRPSRMPFPLHELLQGVRVTLQEAARERNVEVELDAASAAFDVNVDPPRLKQALVNVTRIAIEAAPPQTRVLLRASGGGDVPVRVEIQDERQLPPADGGPEAALTAGAARGSRRRLAITRRIVEAHDGTLSCEARSPRGAVVRIELPACARVSS